MHILCPFTPLWASLRLRMTEKSQHQKRPPSPHAQVQNTGADSNNVMKSACAHTLNGLWPPHACHFARSSCGLVNIAYTLRYACGRQSFSCTLLSQKAEQRAHLSHDIVGEIGRQRARAVQNAHALVVQRACCGFPSWPIRMPARTANHGARGWLRAMHDGP